MLFDLSHDAGEPDINAIVNSVFSRYAACSFRPSNANQFTILAAIILYGHHNALSQSTQPLIKVVTLATGAKCLPTASFTRNGDSLHDSHAEILSRRAFIRWLSEELRRAAKADTYWLQRGGESMKWHLRQDVRVYMYISAVPCGDASMRLLAAMQDPVMAALKDSAPPVALAAGAAARGRDGYALRGVLRTKPGRADAPPTICMACSDKIAAWNVLGLQGALLSQILDPVYLSGVIIGGVPQEMRTTVKEDCERAFYGRLERIEDLPIGSYLRKPPVYFTDLEFLRSRGVLLETNSLCPPPNSSNDSLCWFADFPSGQEALINGVRRGTSAKQRALGRSMPLLCKLQLFRLHAETIHALGLPEYSPGITYHLAKSSSSADYQAARRALKGSGGPFAGWIVSGQPWESFYLDGNIVDESTVTTPDSISLEGQAIQNCT